MSRRIGITSAVAAAGVLLLILAAAALLAGRSALGLAALALASVLIAGLTWLAGEQLIAPLRRLQRATAQVTAGDLTVRAPRTRVAELDELAAGFNELVAALESHHAEVESELAAGASAKRAAEDEAARQREARRVKDAFIDTVSSELREPLTSTRGFLDLMLAGEGGTLTAEQRRFVTVTLRNTERLLRLVEDLLLVAQVEAGAFQLELSEIDVVELAAEAVESARPAAEAAGLTLELTTRGTPTVTGDRARLGELLDNLISNAIKFTASGGRVGVAAEAAHDRVDLLVRDTGAGMTPEEVEQLYTRYFQTARAGRARVLGRGLGIATSKAIAEAHGGSISVKSVVGSGTTFRVDLPAKDG
jgi:signal transduction histidine kinase